MSANRKMKWSDFDQHVRPEHLGGKPVSLQISRVTVDEYTSERGKRTLPTLHFHGTTKDFPLNNTNRRKLMKLFGDDPEAAVGRVVVVGIEKVKAFGTEQDVVRITGVDAEAEKRIAARAGKAEPPSNGKAEAVPVTTAELAAQLNELRAQAQDLGAVLGPLDVSKLSDEELGSEIVSLTQYVEELKAYKM